MCPHAGEAGRRVHTLRRDAPDAARDRAEGLEPVNLTLGRRASMATATVARSRPRRRRVP